MRFRTEILHFARWIPVRLVHSWRERLHGVSGYLRSIEVCPCQKELWVVGKNGWIYGGFIVENEVAALLLALYMRKGTVRVRWMGERRRWGE